MKSDTMKAQIESKWTAGKWVVTDQTTGDSLPHRWICDCGSRVAVITQASGNVARREQSKANASLIAQAPAMLEALELALCYMEADGDDEQEREDYDRIKSIIARAKGEVTP